MPRRATPLNPEDGPLARFALKLRQLRAATPPGRSRRVEDVPASYGSPSRAAIYRALAGTQLPTEKTLEAMVRAWAPEPGTVMDYWIKRRRETEKALAERDLPGEAHASPPERAGAPIRPHRHAAEDRTRVYSGELLVLQLERSSLAQWLKEPVSRGTEKYYEAFRSVLDELPEDGGADRSPGAIRHRLVRQVGIGSPSTLYAVVQRRSFTGAIDEGDCKERLARAHVVTRLAAQAKLWFYRPFRLAWLEGLSRIDAPQGRLAARTLLHALISWVKAESQLACYSEYAPPLIAAQDLSQIVDGQLDFDDAMEFLGRVAERVATSALAIDALVEAAHGDLMSIAFDRPDAVRRSIDQLREPIQEILRSIGNLSSEDEALIPSAQREALRRLAASW